jgi:hypothetical protein
MVHRATSRKGVQLSDMPDKSPEATKRLSLDDFLKEQGKARNKVTIEPIADKQDSVKLTPYVGGTGCLCNLSISVPRAAIKSVEPTGETHLCCGKTLRVVQVEFAEGHSITYPEMLAQLSTQAASVHHEHVESVPHHQPPNMPLWAGASMAMHPEIATYSLGAFNNPCGPLCRVDTGLHCCCPRRNGTYTCVFSSGQNCAYRCQGEW